MLALRVLGRPAGHRPGAPVSLSGGRDSRAPPHRPSGLGPHCWRGVQGVAVCPVPTRRGRYLLPPCSVQPRNRSGILSKVTPWAHLGPVSPQPGELWMCPSNHGWGQV